MRHSTIVTTLLCGLAVVYFSPVGGSFCTRLQAEETVKPAIGTVISDLRFKDIRYIPRSLTDFGPTRAYVLIFTNTTCPLAQKYWPKLSRLHTEYQSRDVQFLSVNSMDGDEMADVAQQAIDFEIPFPVLKDPEGSCAQATGVKRTPEVVILSGKRELLYRGRIDDQHRIGGSRPTIGTDSLADALDALLTGRPIDNPETPVDGCLLTFPKRDENASPVTYSTHIAPILQQQCVECHHPGGPAPFSLTTFEDATAHAEMIAEVVTERRMPPWYGHRAQSFINERGLDRSSRELIARWVRQGRPAGDLSQVPPVRTFPANGWTIGEPDLVTTALFPDTLPAEGYIDYVHTVLPYVFTDDTWISAAEILPSNPTTVHHCNMAYVTLGEPFQEKNFITGRVPGGTAMVLDDGIGFKIPRGSVVALQIHYTTTGKRETNRMSVGFRFPRSVVRQELRHLQATTSRFEIPPGASAHPVTASRIIPVDATGVGMFAHMHLRGKDMTFRACFPDGTDETLLSIPNYHYDWQQNYRWEPGTRKFPAGTRIEVTAHFDNSRFNPFNPDPSVVVRHGPQTVDEMMFGFLFYTQDGENLNLRIDPRTGQRLQTAAPKTEDESAPATADPSLNPGNGPATTVDQTHR